MYVKLGGLGSKCSSDHHLAAFISSAESVSSTVKALIGMKPILENEDNTICLVGLQDVDRRIQHKIQEKFDQKSLNDLLLQAKNVRVRARLQSLLAPNAGAWLTTPPISAPGLHLEAEVRQV